MDYNKIKEIIAQEINNKAFDYIKNRESYKPKKKEKSDYEKNIEEEDIHNTIFHGGSNPLSKKNRNLKESAGDVPQISISEIKEFEGKFKNLVTPFVQFEQNNEGRINYKLYKGDSGIEAKVSGEIPLESENYIEFDFSLQNGPFINARVELTTEVANIIKNLSEFYLQWKDEWSKKLGNLN